MSTVGTVTKATDQQKHGAQSEVFQRLVSPMGFLSRSAPTTFTNENRFTAAHTSKPVGAPASKRALPKTNILPKVGQ